VALFARVVVGRTLPYSHGPLSKRVGFNQARRWETNERASRNFAVDETIVDVE
jgi:hypothetical protein